MPDTFVVCALKLKDPSVPEEHFQRLLLREACNKCVVHWPIG